MKWTTRSGARGHHLPSRPDVSDSKEQAEEPLRRGVSWWSALRQRVPAVLLQPCAAKGGKAVLLGLNFGICLVLPLLSTRRNQVQHRARAWCVLQMPMSCYLGSCHREDDRAPHASGQASREAWAEGVSRDHGYLLPGAGPQARTATFRDRPEREGDAFLFLSLPQSAVGQAPSRRRTLEAFGRGIFTSFHPSLPESQDSFNSGQTLM